MCLLENVRPFERSWEGFIFLCVLMKYEMNWAILTTTALVSGQNFLDSILQVTLTICKKNSP